MIKILGTLADSLILRSQKRFWRRARKLSNDMPTADLTELRRDAKRLKSVLNDFESDAYERLNLPAVQSKAMRKPQNADWSYRPKMWAAPISPSGKTSIKNKTRLNDEISIFHDSKVLELTARQIRNHKRKHMAPFGLCMDVLNFNGSYLSLMVEIPENILSETSKENLIHLTMLVEVERPSQMFARLNLQNGPNKEEVVRELDMTNSEVTIEFDLFFTDFRPESTTKMWIDLSFEDPEMNETIIRDLCIHRRPRAQI